jgi:pimeloyl-ACP methyl ester carboxylesterase
MFPSFIPTEANNLTESTSLELLKRIEVESIFTSFSEQAIATTYVHRGNGTPPILLLHGFDSSVLEFRRLLPLLAKKQETWAVDLLGFGFTERLAGITYRAEEIKTHLYYFWKTKIGQPVILVGASMGGAAAIDFTLTYPNVVDKLVLIDSAGLANPPSIGKFMFPPLDYLATAFLRNPRVRQNISRTAYYDKSLASVDAQICAALHLKCAAWNQALIAFTKSGGYGSFAKKLTAIKQPTLILWGKEDKILGIKAAEDFNKAIAHSQLIWIKHCGHVPHLEQPQITARAILDFV